MQALRKVVAVVGRALLSIAMQEDAATAVARLHSSPDAAGPASTGQGSEAPDGSSLQVGRTGASGESAAARTSKSRPRSSTDLGPAASAVLQAAWEQLLRWDPPRPGVRMRLPLLGQRLRVAVPVDLWLHTGIPGEALAVRAVRSALDRQQQAISACLRRSRAMQRRRSRDEREHAGEHTGGLDHMYGTELRSIGDGHATGEGAAAGAAAAAIG